MVHLSGCQDPGKQRDPAEHVKTSAAGFAFRLFGGGLPCAPAQWSPYHQGVCA